MINNKNYEKNIKNIEESVGYVFKDKEIIKTALTHSSYDKDVNYEKLEFLGDSVLQIIISRYIFEKHNYLNEGEMTVTRAYAVCGETLSMVGQKLSFHNSIIVGSSGKKRKINKNESVIADVFEAITAAIYLDGGLEQAEKFIIKNLAEYIKDYIKSGDNKDYKTKLQHLVQEIYAEEPEYVLKSAKGPDHDKVFVIEVYVKNKLRGKGKGKSKKKAQQEAAMNALNKYDKKGII